MPKAKAKRRYRSDDESIRAYANLDPLRRQILYYLKLQGKTQNDLAKYLGRSSGYLTMFLKKRTRGINSALIPLVAKFLEMPLSTLTADRDAPEANSALPLEPMPESEGLYAARVVERPEKRITRQQHLIASQQRLIARQQQLMHAILRLMAQDHAILERQQEKIQLTVSHMQPVLQTLTESFADLRVSERARVPPARGGSAPRANGR